MELLITDILLRAFMFSEDAVLEGRGCIITILPVWY
jgi:hypothetical protein